MLTEHRAPFVVGRCYILHRVILGLAGVPFTGVSFFPLSRVKGKNVLVLVSKRFGFEPFVDVTSLGRLMNFRIGIFIKLYCYGH